jgi:phenol 2-monooxygenase
VQFYLNGYKPGDPDIQPEATAAKNRSPQLPDAVDVLVVGSGPAGTVLAAQLSPFPAISTRLIERRRGPLELGQADGVACRTVEMFEAFGMSAKLIREAYWVNETVFWRPSQQDRSRIVRTGRVQDVEDGLSEFPHVIVNQARMQEYLLEYMRKSPTRLEPNYSTEFVRLEVDANGEYPVRVTVRNVESGAERSIRAKYVVGCDGARSAVRQSIGAVPQGDYANHAWGVVDMLAVTDFPDIRLKAAIQSADEGNILLIPREGGYLVRLYVDLGDVDPNDRGTVREKYTAEKIVEVAQRVLRPYTLELRDVAWSSVYEVGQRVTDRFDDVLPEQAGSRLPRVFIAGDACHTHSPKAG